MPIKHKLQRTRPATVNELTRRLIGEWRNPKKTGQPMIVLEGAKNEPQHVYVLWDDWGELSHTERSEIIMDVVENLTGEHRIPDTTLITVAMGLTTEEAKRMGIKFA